MVRKIAFECLKEILINKGYSNLVLKNLPESISQKDMGLITQIVYGTLQNYDFLSYQWNDKVERRVKKEMEILLNLSCFQLLFLDRIPDYAVVDEACKLVKPQLRKFIQAILLQCIKQGKKEIEAKDELEKIQIETSIPKWILSMWKAHYGSEEAIKIARALNTSDHSLVARINPIKADIEELKADSKIQMLDEWALTYDGNLIDSEYFNDGKIIIQDYSSQQVAKAVNPSKFDRVLDACSAPGSKTGMMAAMMENQGEIVACEIHEHRLQLMSKGLKLWGVTNTTLVQMDMTLAHENFEKESFDKILLDVPCSGFGVMKKKPDLKFRVQPEDIDSLVLVQKEILESCAQLLKSGGTLVYSTCTLNKKENDKQVERFLKEHPEFECESQRNYFPYEAHQDGFFIAKLIKK